MAVAAQNDQYVASTSRCVAEPVRAGFTPRAGPVGFACPQISGLLDPLTGSGLAAAGHRLDGAVFPRDAGQRFAGAARAGREDSDGISGLLCCWFDGWDSLRRLSDRGRAGPGSGTPAARYPGPRSTAIS